MKIAISGCLHGQLDLYYKSILDNDKETNTHTELFLCTGDFQSCRNLDDLNSMACPKKYSVLGDFHKYYNGDCVAPVLTIFIGGNHEATNYLQSLYYGGWVAPKIFFLGYSGVIKVRTPSNEVVRIAGLSGIHNFDHYFMDYYEKYPFDASTIRSCYHIRSFELNKLLIIKNPIDIILTHDWPSDVLKYGNIKKLLRRKPFFANDLKTNKLANPHTNKLLHAHKPKYWFSSHLHVKFEATVLHKNKLKTKFLALDKPKYYYNDHIDFIYRDFNTKLEENATDTTPSHPQIYFDLEWLAILSQSQHLIPVSSKKTYKNCNIPINYPTHDIFIKVFNQLIGHSNNETLENFTFANKHFINWYDWDSCFTDVDLQKKKIFEITGLTTDLQAQLNSLELNNNEFNINEEEEEEEIDIFF